MKRLSITILILGLATFSLARPELNAFIIKPVYSVPELMAQLKSDKAVLDRYMRHFSMSKAEVIEYIRSLHVGKIQKTGTYAIFSIPAGGQVKSHLSIFKKGTPAFVDKRGNPILRLKCGNPFVKGPAKAYALRGGAPISEESQDFKNTFVPDSAVPTAVIPETTLLASVPTLTPEEELVTNTPAQTLKTVESPQPQNIETQTFSVSSGPSLGAIGALGALGALGAISGNPSGGGPAPVPEPVTVIPVLIGLASLALLKRK